MMPALRWCLLAVFTLVVGGGLLRAEPPAKDPKKPKFTNRLAKESSPYLLQHAHNPVDWYPWGEEAFARAKKEGKLVFLSIGYSSCHWCHVMEKESFADDGVAKLMNENFVCIKVDREERPDVDHIYMTALHVLDQQGGWPLSMFLTAEGKPLVGGTYWPREDKELGDRTLRGFKTILNAVIDAKKKHPKEIEEEADKLAKATSEALAGTARGAALIELDRELIVNTVDELKEQFDPVHGGFGQPSRKWQGTKFPTPPRLLFLQEEAARKKVKDITPILDLTLDKMARGGIYDHLGGGFHRYSTERTWTVPHFEKMLYDNAQLVELFALGYKVNKSPQYERVVRESLAFIAREMTSPDGAFYSALDADSEGEEGKFYVWSSKELAELLPNKEERDLFLQVYGADKEANFEGKYRILVLPETIEAQAKARKLSEAELLAKLEPLKKKLLETRNKRPRPFLDTKVITGWNGQMIAAYAVAGQALNDKKYLDAAGRAADFVLKNLRTKEGRLMRLWAAPPDKPAEAKGNGYLDDYAFLIHGLLCLHDATGEKKWLESAKELSDGMVKFFGDDKIGAFFFTSSDHEKLFARAKDQFDGAQPCGNSVAARNLVRLAAKTGDAKYLDLAVKSFKAMAAPLKNSPAGMTTMASALALYLDTPRKK